MSPSNVLEEKRRKRNKKARLRRRVSPIYRRNRKKAQERDKRRYRIDSKFRMERRNKCIRSRHSTRIELINFLGGKCCKCEFKDWRALQVDHINGRGVKERKIYSQYRLFKDAKRHPEKYQLLCANCNWIKRHENKEWGVKTRKE